MSCKVNWISERAKVLLQWFEAYRFLESLILLHNQPRLVYSTIHRLSLLYFIFTKDVPEIPGTYSFLSVHPCSKDIYSPCYLARENTYSGKEMTDHQLYASGGH